MHLTTCKHPVFITRNGVSRFVPCGHCETCRYIRSSAMSDRIKYEIQQHKYGIFVTLTYADYFLPKYIYDEHNRGFVSVSPLDSFERDDDGIFVSFPYLYGASKEFVEDRMQRFGYVSFLSKTDVQKFLKRLRINICRYIKKNFPYEKDYEISYALCGEYGPTSYRPHMHAIIMFDCEKLVKSIIGLVHKSWPFGSSKSRFLSRGESGQYIAKYVNGLHNCPKIFQFKEFRQFLLVSKSHPIGLYKVSSKEVTESFLKRSATLSIFDIKKGSFCDVPLWSVVENQLYPRFSGYNRLSDWHRIRLLEFAAQFPTIKELQSCVFSDNSFLLKDSESNEFLGFYRQFSELELDRLLKPDLHIKENYLYIYLQLYGKSRCYIHSYRNMVDNALKSLFYSAKRIVRNMHRFQVDSISDYVSIINEYVFNKFIFQMEQQTELESSLEPEMLKYIDCECFTEEVVNHSDYSNFAAMVHFEFEHSKKNRRKHYYLEIHPEYKLELSPDDFSEGFV